MKKDRNKLLDANISTLFYTNTPQNVIIMRHKQFFSCSEMYIAIVSIQDFLNVAVMDHWWAQGADLTPTAKPYCGGTIFLK